MCRWIALSLVIVWGLLGLGNGLVLPPGAVAAIEPGWVVDVAFSPQGNRIALALREEIEIRSTEDLHLIASISLPEGDRVYSLAFLDATHLAVGCGGGKVFVLDLNSCAITGKANRYTGRIWDMAVDPRGRYLAVASGDGGIALLSLPDLSEGFTETIPGEGFYALAFSPDGGTFAAAGKSGVITLFRVPGGEPAEELHGHDAAVWGLEFLSEERLVSAGSDGRAVIWDLMSGSPARVIYPGAERVRKARVRPGGELIALATSEAEVVLWSEGEKAFIGRLLGHKTSLWTLSFSPDGKRLATASTRGRLILWDVEELLALRPRIMEVHYSKRMGRAQYIAVSYVDPNGDASRALIDLVEGDLSSIFVSSFSVGLKTRPSKTGYAPLSPRTLSAEFLIQGYRGKEEGSFTFGLRVDKPQRLVLKIVVADALGLASEARLIEIEAAS